MKSRPANVERSFQRSVMWMVSASALVLGHSEVSWFPAAFTPFVAWFTYLLVDRRKRIRLPVSAANVMGGLAFMAMAWEFSGNNLLGKLLAGAHLLVYITWVVLLLQKGIRQYWWLAALSVLQLAVASVLTTAGTFGVALVSMLALMLWTLSLFTLYRGRIRVAMSTDSEDDSLKAEDSLAEGLMQSSPVTIRNGLQVDSQEPWIGWRFRSIVSFAFVASLLIAVVTFLVFPRVWMPNPVAGISRPGQQTLVSRTGFTEDVQLGDIGQIMQSEGRVLQFEIKKLHSPQRLTPEAFANALGMDEVLFRGNALGQYNNGRWSVGQQQGKNGARSIGDYASPRRFDLDPAAAHLKMKIVQDPPMQTFAFAPAPVTNAFEQSRKLRIGRRSLTSGLTMEIKNKEDGVSTSEPISFEAWFRVPDSKPTRHTLAFPPAADDADASAASRIYHEVQRKVLEQRYAYRWCLTPELESSLPQLNELSHDVCSRDEASFTQRESIQRIMAFLNASGTFQYSLTNSIQDPLIDPVEDFLINRRTGHCEYFASAGALMLQSVGVPARVVNGYKGYEVNSVSGRNEVKQKHAHTWIEAYIDGRWETLDPTPAAAREEAVSQTSQLAWWKDLSSVLNDSWRDFVQSMSPQRQEAMARPVLTAIREKWRNVREQGIWESLKEFWVNVVLHPEEWFSPMTGFVTFVVLLLFGLVLQQNPFRWLKNKLQNWLRPGSDQKRSLVRFYENFRDVCRQNGLPLPEHHTANENAAYVQQHFSGALTSDNDADLPRRIAAAFNQVRFGHTALSAEDIATLGTDVVRLKSLLRAETEHKGTPPSSPQQKS